MDYDGDPATGPLTDANGDHYDVALNLTTLESERVYDNSDNDQTGMKLYTLDGTLITAAWGQDPATSQGGSPFLDLGTTVLPFPIASVEKTSDLVVDENSNGLIDTVGLDEDKKVVSELETTDALELEFAVHTGIGVLQKRQEALECIQVDALALVVTHCRDANCLGEV